MMKHASFSWLFGLTLLLPHTALAGDWDVGIKHLVTTRMVYEGGAGKAGETTNTFTVGEEVLILCQYEYVKVGDKPKFKPWNVTFYVDNILVKTFPVASYEEPHAAPWAIYKTKSSGQHKVKCHLGMLSGPTANDSAEIWITMNPGPPLTVGEIPTPFPPKLSKKISLMPNLDLWMVADIPKKPVRGEEDFLLYSINSPYEQKWHAELVRMPSPGERGAAVSTVGTLLESKVGKFKFAGFGFTRSWLDARGAGVGHYAVRVYFSETANGITTKGRPAVVRFELVEPLKAGSGGPVGAAQPMVSGGKPSPASGPVAPTAGQKGMARQASVKVQPSVTSAIPHLLEPGKGYTLMLQGQGLTQQMVVDLGPGIAIRAGSLNVGTGPEGSTASVAVQVTVDAKPGPRMVRLSVAPGQPWMVQPAKLAVFVERAPKEQGPRKAAPLR